MAKHIKETSPWLIFARILFTFCLLGTIGFIFYNSAQIADDSALRSGRIVQMIKDFFVQIGHPGWAAYLTEHIVRKLAHFAEYALEGFWLMLCIRVYTRHFIKHISWPILGGLLTALCDETIQLFSTGRSGEIKDVWIDFSGVMAGLLVGLFLLCIVRMCVLLYRHRGEE